MGNMKKYISGMLAMGALVFFIGSSANFGRPGYASGVTLTVDDCPPSATGCTGNKPDPKPDPQPDPKPDPKPDPTPGTASK